jgi:folylpolyglutamate synthase/dihydrofolate synthase
VIILEAGIGGRLDSTNVIDTADVSVITSIGIDHVKVLGNSREAIMKEKVQILKEGGHLVVGPVETNLKDIARNWAEEVNGKLTFLDTSKIEVLSSTKDRQIFNYKDWKNVELTFLGLHQIENACVVLEACEVLKEKGYPLSDEIIYRGLKKATWPGRFEKVSEEPLFYIDGAHNMASVNRLVETLEGLFPNEKFHFVIGMMRDKNYQAMIEKVLHLAKEFLIISPDPYRGFDAQDVANDLINQGYKATAFSDIKDVLTYIKKDIPKEDIVIQFGSLYLVGDIKKAI